MWNKKATFFVVAALVVVASLTSVYCWWNTDVGGPDAFCGGTVGAGDVQAALDGPGRVSEVASQSVPGHPELSCTVERTSRFTGSPDTRMTVKTGTAQGAFPFTTAVWKDPAARSYFSDGAVSGSSGYVVLPQACWEEVGNLQGRRVVAPGQETVATVEVTVKGGSADREGLARLLARTARRVAEAAGCSHGGDGEPGALSTPAAPRSTNPQDVCGIQGFSLPKASLLDRVAEPGQEQLTETSRVWACDMDLAGTGDARLSFAATTDATIISAALREPDTFKNLPDDMGVYGSTQAVLHCGKGDVYFAARWNNEYDGVLLDHTRNTTPSYADIRRATFQAFLNTATSSHSCPAVTLPDGR